MNKLLVFLFLTLLFFAKSYGQSGRGGYGITVEITKAKKDSNIYSEVKVIQASPGVDSSWLRFVERNIKTIEVDKQAKEGKYIVTVKFIVSKDGSLSDIQCATDPGFSMCMEMLRIIKKSKNWTPGVPVEARVYRRR